jgi:hypothetical protein
LRRSRVALALLAVLAVLLGYNLVTATSRYVATYEAYDRLALELERFDFAGPSAPVSITIGVGNPSGETLEIAELELTLRAGVHVVGGGQVIPKLRLRPDQRELFIISAAISDQHYVEQLAGQAIEWQIGGRVLVRSARGAESEWITFGTRYITEAA